MIPAALPVCPGDMPVEAVSPPDPLVERYRRLFATIDWSLVPERAPDDGIPGPKPWTNAAMIKALVIGALETITGSRRLRQFFLEHPAVVRLVGWPLRSSTSGPDPIDWACSVPSARTFRDRLQRFADGALAGALQATVRAAQAIDPTVGTVVAVDTTAIPARVRQNNPNDGGRLRRRAKEPLRGDRDCRFGVTTVSNQPGRRRVKEYLYGYRFGLASTIMHLPGVTADLALATSFATANRQDITAFRPLYEQTVANLGHRPPNLTADAAFDAWYVYDACATGAGIAAIAANERGPAPPRTPDGIPICDRGLPMRAVGRYPHRRGGPLEQHYACPLTGLAAPPDAACVHARFARGGCTKHVNTEPGGLIRATLDRTTPAFKAIYRQRTCVERLFAQAKALGLDRPLVRTGTAVDHFATLIIIALNLRTLARLARIAHDAP